MPPRLHNKVAVITGSTRGLGRAVAAAFVREGARVVVSSRSAGAVDEAVAGLGAGDRVSGHVCDVGDHEQVQALARHAVQRFGRIDVWMNNAAIKAPYGRTADVPPDDAAAVIRTNILGTYHGSRVALQHMLKQGSGRLINLSGRGARGPSPYQNAYAPSKAWVANFTRGLAREYAGRGVDIVLFSPGMVLTGLLTDIRVMGRDLEARFRRFPRVLRMLAQPPEVPAEMAVEVAAAGANGRTYDFLGRRRIVAAMAAELWRRARRDDAPLPQITLHVTEPEPED